MGRLARIWADQEISTARDRREPNVAQAQISHVWLAAAANLNNPARQDGPQSRNRVGHQRLNIIYVIGSCAENQNCNSSSCHVLLIPYVLFDGNKHIAPVFCQCKQFAIFFTAKASFAYGHTSVSVRCEREFQFSGNTLIHKQSHFKVAARLDLASSSAAMAASRVTPGKSSRNSLRVRPCSR